MVTVCLISCAFLILFSQSSPESQEILLLAYTYLRTVKYMQCLAVGITCLMHSWVIECCRQNCLVKRDDFLLPSGFSITSKSLITDRQVFKRSASLFKGVRFMLVSHNPKHAESWTSVLKAANAVIVDDFTTPSNSSSRKCLLYTFLLTFSLFILPLHFFSVPFFAVHCKLLQSFSFLIVSRFVVNR